MKIFLLFLVLITTLFADLFVEEVIKQPLNLVAIVIFLIFIFGTLGLTFWAYNRTKTLSAFYTAGGNITGFQNGLAIAGEYMSTASFLGISGLVYLQGFDGMVYAIGLLIGWPIILFLIAEPLKNLGKYTFTDVISYRLRQKPMRTLTAISSIITILLYLIAQMIGAGKLLELLFGLDYSVAVVMVGTLMLIYVTFGGMLATTWVQIIKTILLLSSTTLIALLVMLYVNFDISQLFIQAIEIHPKGKAIMETGELVSDPFSAISLGIALMFGTAGLPHILMRFFTVKSAKEARESVLYATAFISYFYILSFIIGFGAIVLVFDNPQYLDFAKQAIYGGSPLLGGNSMATIYLADAIGGNLLLGFTSAVALATILAVISGLTLAGASALSHDLYANVFFKEVTEKKELNVSKVATLIVGIMTIILGIASKEQNIIYVVIMAFTIAASSNFPLLLLSIKWSRLTTRGALYGGSLGLLTAIILIILGPIVWVDIFGFSKAIFPFQYPALISVSVAFISIILISLFDKSQRASDEIASFEAQYLRSMTGIGVGKASSH